MTSSKRLADEAVEVYPEGLTFFPPLLCASLQSCSADEDYSSLCRATKPHSHLSRESILFMLNSFPFVLSS